HQPILLSLSIQRKRSRSANLSAIMISWLPWLASYWVLRFFLVHRPQSLSGKLWSSASLLAHYLHGASCCTSTTEQLTRHPDSLRSSCCSFSWPSLVRCFTGS